jgi:putative transcription factor
MINVNNHILYIKMDQDWTVVVLKPKHKKVPQSSREKADAPREPKYNAGKNIQKQQVTSARKIEEKVDDGDLTLPSVTRNLQLQIQQARQAKKMTQKQLAQASNLLETVVKSYENGSAIPNSQDLIKMGKVLGVTLKNK